MATLPIVINADSNTLSTHTVQFNPASQLPIKLMEIQISQHGKLK
jgi:hypothetical protein